MPVLGKTKQEALSEFRCLEILEAARSVFAKKGFNEATMDDIAEAAAVAKGTLYLYFPSKRMMYLEALRQGIEVLHMEIGKNMQAAATTRQKIWAFIDTRIKYFEENRDMFKIYYSEFGNIFCPPADLHKVFRNLSGKQVKMLQRVLQAGMRHGELRPIQVAPMAFAIYDLTRGLIATRFLGWAKGSAAEDAAFIFDVVWKGIEKR